MPGCTSCRITPLHPSRHPSVPTSSPPVRPGASRGPTSLSRPRTFRPRPHTRPDLTLVESGCSAVAFRLGLAVPGPFGRRCLIIPASPRFYTPLIEPCVRISRTRLSDKNSCGRTREAPPLPTQADQSQHLVQVPIGVATHPPSRLVLGAQPPTQPMASVPVHGTVRRAHGAEAEVVRPAPEGPVQSTYPVLNIRPEMTTVGQLADHVPQARDPLRRRANPQVGAA